MGKVKKVGKVKVELNLAELDIEEFDWETSTWKKVSKKELDKLPDNNVTLH